MVEPRTLNLSDGRQFTYFSNLDFSWDDDENELLKISIYCRVNALTMIQFAGSGHIGSSLSVIDPMISVKSHIRRKANDKSVNSIFFTSKGHDAPGLYSIFHALGSISDDELLKLRRLGGLPGHPEIHIPGVPTNTGSLGMGISKAKGFIYGARIKSEMDPDVFVFLGDGELQEGQIWESMSTAKRDGLDSLCVIVDGNQIQSDTWVSKTNDLGDLRKRVESFGWNFFDCDGHDIPKLLRLLQEIDSSEGPSFVYAQTLKGSGVKKFEDFGLDGEFYKYHSGSVTDVDYQSALTELLSLVEKPENKRRSIEFGSYSTNSEDMRPKVRAPNLIEKWAEILLDNAQINSNLVAVDADLSYDTGTYLVKKLLPKQYIQFGIAEQDMVSTAGTIALAGGIPVVHSFASFLTGRAYEQIFNNSTENTRIIYLGFLAGLLPSAPGHSHQSVMDLGVMGIIPGIKLFEPACSHELRLCLVSALQHLGPSYIRVGSYEICPDLNSLDHTSGLQVRKSGDDLLIIASGPSAANWALSSADIVENHISTAVCTRPFLSQELLPSDVSFMSQFSHLIVLENHLPYLGTYHEILRMKSMGVLPKTSITRIGLASLPANGQAEEVLRFHRLHPEQIATQILEICL